MATVLFAQSCRSTGLHKARQLSSTVIGVHSHGVHGWVAVWARQHTLTAASTVTKSDHVVTNDVYTNQPFKVQKCYSFRMVLFPQLRDIILTFELKQKAKVSLSLRVRHGDSRQVDTDKFGVVQSLRPACSTVCCRQPSCDARTRHWYTNDVQFIVVRTSIIQKWCWIEHTGLEWGACSRKFTGGPRVYWCCGIWVVGTAEVGQRVWRYFHVLIVDVVRRWNWTNKTKIVLSKFAIASQISRAAVYALFRWQ